jgi:hypothetical protein
VRRPKVEDCWAGTSTAVLGAWSVWHGAGPVDCSEPHDAITVAVYDLDPSFVRPLPVAGSDVLGPAEQAAVDDACSAAAGYLDVTLPGTRVRWATYLSSWADWRHGERWLRCDLVVQSYGPMNVGSYDPLPATAAEVAAELFDEYLACYTPISGADDATLELLGWFAFAPCDGTEYLRYVTVVPLLDGPYPGEESLTGQAASTCEAESARVAPGRAWQVTVPTADEWARASRTAYCWLVGGQQ